MQAFTPERTETSITVHQVIAQWVASPCGSLSSSSIESAPLLTPHHPCVFCEQLGKRGAWLYTSSENKLREVSA